MIVWTDDLVQQLTDMRKGGLTYGQIARVLGLSRCSVIGKGFRLKLPRPPKGPNSAIAKAKGSVKRLESELERARARVAKLEGATN